MRKEAKIFSGLSLAQKYVVLALATDFLLKSKRPVVFQYLGKKELQERAKEFLKINSKKKSLINALHILEEETSILEDAFPFFHRTYLISQIHSLIGTLEFTTKKLIGDNLKEAVKYIIGVDEIKPYNLDNIYCEYNSMIKKYNYRNYNEFKEKCTTIQNTKISLSKIKKIASSLQEAIKTDILPNIFYGEKLKTYLDKSHVNFVEPKKSYPPCYYMYDGNYSATISLSGEHRKNELNVIRTLLHELYPGHHLYYLYREMLYKFGMLSDEATIDLFYSAETPINEGIAETALFYLKSLDQDFYRAMEISTAREHFGKKILFNVWYYYFIAETITKNEVIKYLMTHAEFTKDKAKQWFSFISEWRVYYPSYPIGTDLVKRENLHYLYIPKSIPVLRKQNT